MKRRFGFVSNLNNNNENGEEKIYMKSFKLASIQKQGLDKVIPIYKENLETTHNIIKYCNRNNIKFYRFGNIFPFNTHEILKDFNYLDYFENEIYELAGLIKATDTRISIHSSPFCILNSSNKDVLEKSVKELSCHAKFMNMLNLPSNNRCVVHVGGMFGGRENAKKEFIKNFLMLREDIKSRMVLENDDKIFSFKDVEDIHRETKVPIVLDVFHHRVLNPENIEELETLQRAFRTWKINEIPEIHYSCQDPEKVKGSHAAVINIEQLSNFLSKVKNMSFDILLETPGTNREVERINIELGDIDAN